MDSFRCDEICKNNSNATDRDSYRICPSKLTRRELEDLYFASLENNSNLKRTVNSQQDKLKQLTTKLLRMERCSNNNQKLNSFRGHNCNGNATLLNEQKLQFEELKQENQRMQEKIRQLNMRLCSKKQFCRVNSQATGMKNRCSSVESTRRNNRDQLISNENAAATLVDTPNSETNIAAAVELIPNVHSREEEIENNTLRNGEHTERTDQWNDEKADRCCKCLRKTDELKEKIVNLQEELAASNKDYSNRIIFLKEEVERLQLENKQSRASLMASQHNLVEKEVEAKKLAAQLREVASSSSVLKTELSLEKKKVLELGTQVRAGEKSNDVMKRILDNRLIHEQTTSTQESSTHDTLNRRAIYENHTNEEKDDKKLDENLILSVNVSSLDHPVAHKAHSSETEHSETLQVLYKNTKRVSLDPECERVLNEDDKEPKNEQVLADMNKRLLKKLSELQSELDALRGTANIAIRHKYKDKAIEAQIGETRIRPRSPKCLRVYDKESQTGLMPHSDDYYVRINREKSGIVPPRNYKTLTTPLEAEIDAKDTAKTNLRENGLKDNLSNTSQATERDAASIVESMSPTTPSRPQTPDKRDIGSSKDDDSVAETLDYVLSEGEMDMTDHSKYLEAKPNIAANNAVTNPGINQANMTPNNQVNNVTNVPEKSHNTNPTYNNSPRGCPAFRSTSIKVEDTLRNITTELSKCRQLLGNKEVKIISFSNI